MIVSMDILTKAWRIMMETVQSVLKGKNYFVFDLDNTLINTEKSHLQGLFYLCRKFPNKKSLYNQLIDMFDEMKTTGERSTKSTRYLIYKSLGLDKEVAFYRTIDAGDMTYEEADLRWDVESLDKVYWDGVGKYIELNENADDMLLGLTELGKKVSILSNGGSVQHNKIKLLKEEVEPLVNFDMTVVTGDYGKRHFKPDSYCLEKIIKHYDAPRSEVVYIGDRVFEDYGVARNSAIDFLLYDPDEINHDFNGVRFFELMELVQ
jgi:FMN phosphatase YigB (HAD superfamily)